MEGQRKRKILKDDLPEWKILEKNPEIMVNLKEMIRLKKGAVHGKLMAAINLIFKFMGGFEKDNIC